MNDINQHFDDSDFDSDDGDAVDAFDVEFERVDREMARAVDAWLDEEQDE